MATLQRIQDFLAHKRFAYVGVSRQPKDFSRALFREFRAQGYDPVPVHPLSKEIDGIRCFRSVREIGPPVEGVLLMTPPPLTATLLPECAQAGIKRIWIYRDSPGAVKFCEENGIDVVSGECPFMFFPEASFIHRFHGFVRKVAGAYPE